MYMAGYSNVNLKQPWVILIGKFWKEKVLALTSKLVIVILMEAN